MEYAPFHRYFTNNHEYGKRKTPYLDSLAYTVQEFLYTKDKATQKIKYRDEGGRHPRIKTIDCEMDDRILLYDFVTIAFHCINALASEYAKAELKEYLANLKQNNTFYNRDKVIHTNDNGIYIPNASSEMVFAILWAAWIYLKVFVDLNPNKVLETRIQLLYDAMKENYPSSEKNFNEHPLIAHAPDAMKLMLQHINAKMQKSKPSHSSEEEHAEDNSKLQTRIKELEKENLKLKEQIELLQSPEGAPVEIEGHGAVRLELLRLLMDKDGAVWEKHGNKVIAASLMTIITGLAFKTCKNHLSDPIVKQTEHQKEILEVNSKLQALGMSIRL